MSPPGFPPSSTRVRRDAYHKKRFSLARLSSDTTATLPEYTSPPSTGTGHIWSAAISPEPFEQPPDYPDSAEEADEETDDYVPLSPPLSPRRHRRFRSVSRTHKHPYSNSSADLVSASDTFLDSLLERSVHALELSNTLLQSSMSTQSSLATVLGGSDSGADQLMESQARILTSRIRENRGVHAGWMDDLDDLAKGVENLYGDGVKNRPDENAISRSLPTSGVPLPPRRNPRRPSLELRRNVSDAPRLHMSAGDHRHNIPPPRALTQYVSVESALGDALESTADLTSIYLPSTIGLRAASHVADLRAPAHRPPPLSQPLAYNILSSAAGQTSPSRSSSPSSKRPSRSITPQAGERHRPRSKRRRSQSSSRSWSSTSNGLPSSSPMHRHFPSPIEELTSPSDSSASVSSGLNVCRTVESLRKILDEQPLPANTKGKAPMEGAQSRSTPFPLRSPPVTPVSSTSSTTTSISRLLTKGTHSTSTRAPPPPKHSSLKGKSPLTLTIPEASSSQSRTSSGRSTPRQVAFGPLPESYASSKGGGSSKFREKQKGNARGKEKKRDSVGDSSWWTTWLTGGSGLSMSAARHEERMEERVARSLGRPGTGASLEEWAV